MPIVLATYPAVYGIKVADFIFHLVFIAVITLALLRALTRVPCARWLGVTESEVRKKPE